MDRINTLHATIKFTCSYNIKDRSTTFLDTLVTLTDSDIATDLYRKPTDRVQYLLPSSCHPAHIFKSVPYSMALRLVRIVSNRKQLVIRMSELKQMLVSRCYNKNIIDAAIKRALDIPREQALLKVVKPKVDRVMFAVTYNPKLPSISKIIVKHWRTMVRDKKLSNTFKEPPMVAFRQPQNLRSMLCHAKIPAKVKATVKKCPAKKDFGMKKCNRPCPIDIHVWPAKSVISTQTGEKHTINGEFTCFTSGVIYLTTCEKCKKQYIGQTGRTFHDRIREHMYDIKKGKKTSGLHYKSEGHVHLDFKVQIIEKVTPNTEFHRLEREEYWIKKFVTKTPFGLNVMT